MHKSNVIFSPVKFDLELKSEKNPNFDERNETMTA